MYQCGTINRLLESEQERIVLLMEECGEVVQICAKILRHGYESYDPRTVDGPSNRELLEKEIGHVRLAMVLMAEKNDVNTQAIGRAIIEKQNSIGQWLHHNVVRGDGSQENPEG